MNKILVLLSVTVATSFGADWKDLRVGDIALPTKQNEAEDANWEAVETDESLEIKWFAKDNDLSLSIAYDSKGNCAGVKTTWLESDFDSDFLDLLSSEKAKGFIEACEVNGEKAFKSTVLFTDEKILKSGGREMLKADEVALAVLFKQGKSYKKITSDGCVAVKANFYEQSCQSGYGQILAGFGSKTTCETSLPFYTVYEPAEYGDLLGFGWLLSTKNNKEGPFLKPISTDLAQTLYPDGPSCLTASTSLTAVEVWLAYSDSLKTSCQDGSYVDNYCQNKISNHPIKGKKSDDSSSSSESDDSSSSSENKKSFWEKLFRLNH